jgi:ubiquilin
VLFTGTTANNAQANPFAAMGGMGGGTGGGGGMGGAMAMMQQPGMMQAVAGMMSNPAMMSMMENSNPALKAMLDSTPGMREMLSNEDFIRQAMNPATMQAMQGMMGGGGGTGGGPPAPGPPPPPAPATGQAPFDMAGMMQAMQAMQGGGGGVGAMPSGTTAAPSNVNYEELYSSQIAEMETMGFTDKEANVRALKAAGGNVQFAINRLFGD